MSSDNVSVKALTGQGAPAFRVFAKAGPVHSSRQISGYVVMPEHVHLLLGEPERGTLALSLPMMKQCVSRKLNAKSAKHPLWQPRYYDFDVWSEYKHVEKLRYIQPNPATSRAVAHCCGRASCGRAKAGTLHSLQQRNLVPRSYRGRPRYD